MKSYHVLHVTVHVTELRFYQKIYRYVTVGAYS